MEQPRKSRYNRDRWELDRIRYKLSKPPAPKREVRGLDELLPKIVEGLQVAKSENLTVLQENWAKLCGAQIARHSKPGALTDYVLYVYVDLPGWLPELERIKRMLLQKVQANYRVLNIRQIRLVLEHK